MFRGDDIFRVAEDELLARDGRLSFVDCLAFEDIHGPDERRVLAELGTVCGSIHNTSSRRVR